MLSSRSPGRSGNRGRARERERPAKKEVMPRHRSREREAVRSNGRRPSVSPRRNDRAQGGADKSRRIPSLISSKLRMDESDRRDKAHGSSRKTTGGELDRVMKKAREDQDRSYWDKRVLEAEDRDQNRWGHSGFKELYTKDGGRRGAGARRRSPEPQTQRRNRTPDRRVRQPPRRSRSDSRRRRQREREVTNSRPNSFRADARDNRSRPQRERNGTIKSRLGSKPLSSSQAAAKRLSGTRRRSASHSSRSRSRSPKRKRMSAGSAGRSKKRSDSRSSYSSRSPSSSTGSSSEDDDVLEIHAGRRKGSGSSSVSSYSSSDSRSISSSSGRSKSNHSGSSSGSESSSGSDSDVSGKIHTNAAKKKTSGASKDAKSQSKAGKKRPPAASSSSKASKVAKKASTSKKSKPANASVAADSDSESGSSSDSDSEPRMTLSERFSKLTQTSTDKDKREFAKPMLAASEIDTKLKVVKDLKNADTKIYVDGVAQSPKTSSKAASKERARSPVRRQSEGDQQFPSVERRDYFDRMERDGPNVLPENWGDARVRYEYYRDRGCFDERPLTFDEYIKWEQWYYQYRDWLENEGYYAQAEGTSASRYGAEEWNRYGRSEGGGGGRRVEQVPMSRRPQFAGRDDDRSIGRAPGGSLVVNIRQGATNNTGIRDRHVGIVRSRNSR